MKGCNGSKSGAKSAKDGTMPQELTPEKLRELLKEGERLRRAFRSQYEPARATGAEEMRYVYR